MGDHFRQSGLAGSWRAIENDGAQLVGLNRPVKQGSGPYDMFLTYYLIQSLRPHAGG